VVVKKSWEQIWAEKFGRDWRKDVKHGPKRPEIVANQVVEGRQMGVPGSNPTQIEPSNPPNSPFLAEKGVFEPQNGLKSVVLPPKPPICTKIDEKDIIGSILASKTGFPYEKELRADGSLMITHKQGWILHLIRTVIGLRARVYDPEYGWSKRSAKVEFKEEPGQVYWLEYDDTVSLFIFNKAATFIAHTICAGQLYRGDDDVILMTQDDFDGDPAKGLFSLPPRAKDIEFTCNIIPWSKSDVPTF
jgi:hypothetical protein